MSNTLQFCVFEKAHDVPSGSGYCQKLETLFRACSYADYEVKFSTVFQAPKGKLPYIVVDGKPIADSHFIIRYLIREGKIKDLDEGLTPLQRAESRSWQAYIEELVYPATVWTRFAYPENWVILKEEAFGNIPFPISYIIQWIILRRVGNGLRGHGIGRHTREEVDSIIEEFVGNLIVRLDASKANFFHGSTPTIIDCVVYGFLANALKMRSNPTCTDLILNSDTLRQYVARGTRIWFPEYTRLLEMVESTKLPNK